MLMYFLLNFDLIVTFNLYYYALLYFTFRSPAQDYDRIGVKLLYFTL